MDGNFNLKKSEFKDDERVLDNECDCPTCRDGHSRAELRALLKSGDLSDHAKAYNLLTIHNVRFIVRLCEQIRQAIIDGYYDEYKRNFCDRYYR